MKWNQSYETGVHLMDTQHQELFRQMDKLTDKSQADRIPQTLDFLGKYVDKHFREEEDLHLSSGYPHRMEHKQLHKDFVEHYRELREEYTKKAQQQGLMSLRINRVAVDWLQKHILGPDMMFAKYYHEKNGTALPGGKEASAKTVTRTPHTTGVAKKPLSGDRKRTQSGSPTEEEVLKRASPEALARELVRRTEKSRYLS